MHISLRYQGFKTPTMQDVPLEHSLEASLSSPTDAFLRLCKMHINQWVK